MRPGGNFFQLIPGLRQHSPHGAGTGRQRRSPQQHVADPLTAPFRMRLLQEQDRPLRQLWQPAPLGSAPRMLGQPRRAVLGKLLLPGIQRVLRDPHQGSKIPRRQPAPLPTVQDQQPLCRREWRPGLFRLGGRNQPPAAPGRPSRPPLERPFLDRAWVLITVHLSGRRGLPLPRRLDRRLTANHRVSRWTSRSLQRLRHDPFRFTIPLQPQTVNTHRFRHDMLLRAPFALPKRSSLLQVFQLLQRQAFRERGQIR